MKKVFTLTTLMLLSVSVLASGNDRVRDNDGPSCEQAVDTGKSVYMEVYGDQGGNDYDHYYPESRYNSSRDDKGVRIGVEFQFGGAERIDCNRFYNNVMSKKDIQLQKAQHELEMLKKEMVRLNSRGNTDFVAD